MATVNGAIFSLFFFLFLFLTPLLFSPKGLYYPLKKADFEWTKGEIGCRRSPKQEHLEECRECDFKKRKLNITSWKGKFVFWRRMTTKISARGKGDDDGC